MEKKYTSQLGTIKTISNEKEKKIEERKKKKSKKNTMQTIIPCADLCDIKFHLKNNNKTIIRSHKSKPVSVIVIIILIMLCMPYRKLMDVCVVSRSFFASPSLLLFLFISTLKHLIDCMPT